MNDSISGVPTHKQNTPSAAAAQTRWSICAALSGVLILALVFVHPVAPRTTPAWDFFMQLGAWAAAIIFVLPLVSPRMWTVSECSPAQLQSVIVVHRVLSYTLVCAVLFHVVGALMVEPVVWEYISLRGPTGILASLLATALIVVLVVSSDARARFGIHRTGWRNWHIGMSLAVVLCTSWHIIDANYYVNHPLKYAVLIWLAIAPSLALLRTPQERIRGLRRRQRRQNVAALSMSHSVTPLHRLLTWSVILWLLIAALYVLRTT